MNKTNAGQDLRELLKVRMLDPYNLATAIFDTVGRYATEEDLGDFTMNEVEEMQESRTAIFDTLKDVFGEQVAKESYGNWIKGHHDT